MRCRSIVLFVVLGLFVPMSGVWAGQAEDILAESGVTGGLIVHLGCGDGKLTAELCAGEQYLVHGLDTDPENVAEAREHIQRLGLYGKVSVEVLDGVRLPYVDNLVNLLVVEDRGDVSAGECMRVVAPGGVICSKSGGKWHKMVKRRSGMLDEWTHHLHDAGGNAVGEDRVVGPPQHLQWTAGPIWARSHGWTPSVSAMVSAGGRLFYICDETLPCADASVPSKWALVARDAFSGVLLWKCPVSNWDSVDFSGTPSTGGHGVVGRFTMPPNIGKRLVAVGDTVYVTLGPRAPVTALDAATGKRKCVYGETAGADEILCADGRLIVSINPSEKTPDAAPAKRVCAVDIKTGDMLWDRGGFAGIRTSIMQDPFGRLELAAGGGRVFVLTTDAIECLDGKTGQRKWREERPALPEDAVTKLGYAGMYEYLSTVMVYHDGVVLLAQPEPNTHHTYHTMPGTLYAYNARNGRRIWKHGYGAWGHCTPPDVFVVGDVVWTHVNAETEFGSVWGKGYKAKDPSIVDYRIQALDLDTGEVRKELATKDVFNVGHHHRCYRNKITEKFMVSSRRGVEFVDLETGENYQNHWVRSGCLLGYVPCNGLLYVTPHPCGCYINAKINGFNALAPRRETENKIATRLVKGPAYRSTGERRGGAGGPGDWPTFRHDSRRSGATESAVSSELEIAWKANIGTKPSALVVAGGKVLVSGVDTHSVHALNAGDGKQMWKYTMGGRVDSPPTYRDGFAICGSADGRVYCLRAEDGELAWRFEAAPQRGLMSAFGQLESAWPVPGSVMMHEGKCWFAAGRSSYIDDGIHLYGLDPVTGNADHEDIIYSPDPETGKSSPEPDGFQVAGVLNDIPVTDGTNVFIRQMNVSSGEDGTGKHLFATGGYLDRSWFNRTYWQIGKAKTSGLMVLGDEVAYGVEVYASRSREVVFKPGGNAYRLRCLPLTVQPSPRANQNVKRAARNEPKPVWEKQLDIRVTAMIRAADKIFVAGSPDIVDPEDPHGAWEGRKGGVLAVFSAEDGERIKEYKLPAPPVWDGMAAAQGKLFISTVDGGILCMVRPGSREVGG